MTVTRLTFTFFEKQQQLAGVQTDMFDQKLESRRMPKSVDRRSARTALRSEDFFQNRNFVADYFFEIFSNTTFRAYQNRSFGYGIVIICLYRSI